MQQLFIKQFAANADINSSISIQIESFQDEPSDSQGNGLVEYAVFNHTSEDISFENNSFGLRIFSLNETSGEWQELIPTIHPYDMPTKLLAGTESFGPQTNNSYLITFSNFDGELPSKLRLFVTGIGKLTNKTYVAFVDLLRKIH